MTDPRPLPPPGLPHAWQLLDALVSSAPVGVAVFDADLRFVLLNEQAAATDGIPVEAHVGRTIREVLPGLAEKVEPILRRVRDTGEAVTGVEISGATPAAPGEERHWVTSYFPIPGPGGRPARIAALALDVTERRRLERSLRETRERYHRLFLNMPAAVTIAEVLRDAEGRVEDWILRDVNAAALRELAVDRARVVGRRASALLGPAALAPFLAICREVMASGEARQWEHALAITGKTYLTSFFALDERSFVTASFDVTRRVQLEADLRRDGELLRLSHDAMLVWSSADGVESWSRGAEELYGWTAAEARGRSPHALLRTACPVAWEAIEAELRTHERWSGELVHTTREGRAVTVSSRLQLFRGEDGAERVLEVDRDVSERRRFEAQLASAARFPEENPDPVLRVSSALAVVYANQAALGGLAPLGVALGAPAPDGLAGPVRRALAAGGRVRAEIACGGRVFSLVCVAVGDEVNVYAQDVTARTRAEERLRDEGERKSAFLAVLSHELRNPLAPIQNALGLLDRAAPGSAPSRRAKEVVDRQLGHLVRLVDDLLDVTRISHGKILLRRTVLDARALALRACEDLRSLFDERRVTLRHALPDAPLWVDADATRLAQVIGNLLTNGAKFTPAGGTVTLALERRGDACELRVRDDGPGIAPAELERIFEPFAQAERTRGVSEGGVGLGLALVKSLVELHGGSVQASSAGHGRGAEFVVALPLAQAPREAAAPGEARRRAGAPLDVLVVDDNGDAADTLAELLALEGHTARVARDGRSALAACAAALPDVLVCDIGLPDVSGHDVIRALRALEGGRRVFAVALSGYAQPEDLERARRAGFDAHLAKPPPLERLAELLARAGPAATP